MEQKERVKREKGIDKISFAWRHRRRSHRAQLIYSKEPISSSDKKERWCDSLYFMRVRSSRERAKVEWMWERAAKNTKNYDSISQISKMRRAQILPHRRRCPLGFLFALLQLAATQSTMRKIDVLSLFSFFSSSLTGAIKCRLHAGPYDYQL